MITYSAVNPYDIRDELLPLNEQHYEEDWRGEAALLDINWDLYDSMYKEASLIAIIARNEEGVLVGYMMTTIVCHPHIRDYKFASMDNMFVDREYRGLGIASDLLETTEEILVDQAVSWFALGFRDEAVAESVAGKFGYSKVECTFGKTLRSN